MRQLTILCLLLCACGGAQKESNAETKVEREQAAIYIDTMQLTRCTFNKQIVCNGKLRAALKSDLIFDITGKISKINVKNGDYIESGTTIAHLDTEEADINLSQSIRALEKANIDLIDKLIGQGYDADTTAVPKVIMDNAKHTSGYNTAMDNLEAARRELSKCYLHAPFSGRIANLDSKIHNMTAESFCTLINDQKFDVEFNILEAELGEISKGQKIEVTPFIDEERQFSGVISEINPLIDDNGHIKIRATVQNREGYLLEGMNVKLILNREIPNQFVVPKDAVVLRDGFNVIFLYVDGEAVWTYVDVEMSNIDSHLITGNKEKETTLKESDIVITSGNSNIADGTKVKIK